MKNLDKNYKNTFIFLLMLLLIANASLSQINPSQKIGLIDIKTDSIVGKKVDSLISKYQTYSGFTEDGMKITGSYLKAFSELFHSGTKIYDDLSSNNNPVNRMITVREYSDCVKEHYPEGLGVQITGVNKKESIFLNNEYYIIANASKRLIGYHKLNGRMNKTYNMVMIFRLSSSLHQIKIIKLAHSESQPNASLLLSQTIEEIANHNIGITGKSEVAISEDAPLPLEKAQVNESKGETHAKRENVSVIQQPGNDQQIQNGVGLDAIDLSFLILDDDSKPIANAKVILEYNGIYQQQKFTKDNGEVVFPKVPINIPLTITAENTLYYGQLKIKAAEMVNVIKPINTKKKKITLKVDIRVKVVNEDLSTLSGAKLILKYRNETKFRVLTDQDGEALITQIPEDEIVTVAAMKNNLLGSISGVASSMADQQPLLLVLKDTTNYVSLNFSVINRKNRRPVGDAYVQLRCQKVTLEGTTSEAGNVEFPKVQSNSYVRYSVYRQGFYDEHQTSAIYVNKPDEFIVTLQPLKKPSYLSLTASAGKVMLNQDANIRLGEGIVMHNDKLEGKFGYGFGLDYSKCLFDSRDFALDFGIGAEMNYFKVDFTTDSIFQKYHTTDTSFLIVKGRNISEIISLSMLDIPMYLKMKFKFENSYLSSIYLKTGLLLSYNYSGTAKPKQGIFNGQFNNIFITGTGIQDTFSLIGNFYGYECYPDRHLSSFSYDVIEKKFSLSYLLAAGAMIYVTENIEASFGLRYGVHLVDIKNGINKNYIISSIERLYSSPLIQLDRIKSPYIGIEFGISYKL